MRKRRFIPPIFVLFLTLLLTSCAAPAPSLSDETADDPPSDAIVVGFSQTGAESNWRVANSESIRAALSEENGYELLFSDAQQKQENQIRAIRKFIQQKVDYIVFAPLVETGWDEVLQEAKDAGIPVIVIDRMVDAARSDLYTCFVGSDFKAEGKLAADWMSTQYAGRADPLHIVEIIGTPGSTPQLGRSQGLADGIAAHESWTLDAQLEGEFTTAKASDVFQQYLTGAQVPDVLVCQNDDMAFGVMKVLDAAGIPYGPDEKEVKIISFDATRSGLEGCLAGQIALDVECNPLHGPYVANIIQHMEAGQAPPRTTYTTEGSFTADTLSAAQIDARPY